MSTINSMSIRDANQHANNAGRGSLSALETVIKALAEGAVYDTYAGNPTGNVTPKAKGSWVLDTSSNIWYRAKALTNTDWVAIGEHGLTAAELTVLNVVAGVGAASRALVLDTSGRVSIPSNLPTTRGVGITGGSGALCKTSVEEVGDVITTQLLIDITGLNSNVVGDIIGDDGTGAAFLGKLTTAVNGTILGGYMQCLEAPATGEPDIDLFAADEGTGVEDTAISALTNDAVVVVSGADWTLGLKKWVTGIPADNQHLYLVGGGGTTDATYTAGKFLIKLYGYNA